TLGLNRGRRRGTWELTLMTVDMDASRVRVETPSVVTAADGAGPLLQRDYWAVFDDCIYSPEQVMALVRSGFPRLSPEDLARFTRLEGASEPLALGDRMAVDIKLAGACQVQIVHDDDSSLTMRTLDDHPEAGRITFGAECVGPERLLFRIRSRARAN